MAAMLGCVQPSGGARLAVETLARVGHAEPGLGRTLERDVPSEPRVFSKVDFAHAAASEALQHGVRVRPADQSPGSLRLRQRSILCPLACTVPWRGARRRVRWSARRLVDGSAGTGEAFNGAVRRRHPAHWRADPRCRRRTVEDRCGGHAIGPGDAWRIDGGEIPEMSTALAAVLGRLWRPRILLHLLRERVPAVPILLHARVRHPPQNRRDRWRLIGHQDRLPHCEHATRVPRRSPLEHVLNCGGPPQTDRSRRGQQEDDARPVGVAIEVGAERFQAGGAENRRVEAGPEAPAAGRRGTRASPPASAANTPDENGEAPIHGITVGEKAGEQLREQHRHHDDRRRHAQHDGGGPGRRRACPAGPAQLETADDQQDDRRTEKPRLVVDHEQPHARRCGSRRKASRQTAQHRRQGGHRGGNGRDLFAGRHLTQELDRRSQSAAAQSPSNAGDSAGGRSGVCLWRVGPHAPRARPASDRSLTYARTLIESWLGSTRAGGAVIRVGVGPHALTRGARRPFGSPPRIR